ncbi:uncharacterized protein LOC119927324 [Tachyglossus aculeatus]|uniref:uncharacterized protein LOC119927324 n=1 Tax=Tachyglossus aculeatus TaxID=9261 RepID=UPI0018F6FD08|nr:uncharacterized protein LOC119927324 [Tachyglossus aculeatus]
MNSDQGRRKEGASRFLSSSTRIQHSQYPPLYKLNLRHEQMGEHSPFQKCTFGTSYRHKENKVIMLMGATGTGKTMMINAMANYILGVAWEDEFRFKLITEETFRSQAESQTSIITAYHLAHQDGFQVPYSLTIIDTPGFGDTRGIDHDQALTEHIREFFSSPRGIDHLDAVCFVVQASLPRLTHTQRYIFDSILSIFGKNIADNVRVLVTFADGQKPPVLEAVKIAQVPCPKNGAGDPIHFKFNNSALFCGQAPKAAREAGEEEEEEEVFDEMFWRMGNGSLRKFFTELDKLQSQSLSLTQEVLKERKQLEVIVEGLHVQIQNHLMKMEEFRKITEVLEQNKDKMKANENFEYETSIMEPQQEAIKGYITNCQKCHYTCHCPCLIADDHKKHNCSAMNQAGNCNVCPQKCHWNVHFNQLYRWNYVPKTVKGTYQNLKENYEKAHGELKSAEQLSQKLKEDLERVESEAQSLIEDLSCCIHRLEDIALRPNPLSIPEYIDILIISEKEEAKQGFQERIESLNKLKTNAELLSTVSQMPVDGQKTPAKEKKGKWYQMSSRFAR